MTMITTASVINLLKNEYNDNDNDNDADENGDDGIKFRDLFGLARLALVISFLLPHLKDTKGCRIMGNHHRKTTIAC